MRFYIQGGQAINGNFTDTDIIYNEFSDSPCDIAEDTCSIYLNYLDLNDGVKIRYNYFHDITNMDHVNIGFDFARRSAVGYDNNQPFHDFSYNVVYNVPTPYNFLTSPTPSTTFNNILIDCDHVMEAPPEDYRDIYSNMTPLEVISNFDTLPMYYLTGIYKTDLWREKYPDLYEYYNYMENEKQDMHEMMTQTYNNLVVNIDKSISERATQPEDIPELPTDKKYGRIENNTFESTDIGFADYENYNFQLSEETANAYDIEWLDMSKIGVASVRENQPKRVLPYSSDPLKDVKPETKITVAFTTGTYLTPISIWREISKDVWQWAGNAELNNELMVGFSVKAGGTYTVYYSGDDIHYAQFAGGQRGQTPPNGVLTFTVPEDQNRWDAFTFDIVPIIPSRPARAK